ncbi:MAG: DUF3341 domain-containing protein [Spirochaetota bacterium]|nr:DUF3341 domain-containing protein [Spirochaetota bacterium]
MAKKVKIGFYNDEGVLLSALKVLRHKDIKIHNVFTPYPVHGLDDIIGLKKSRLPIVAFIVGALGAFGAMGFQIWSLALDWTINIGGKPGLAIPSFVPITFEIMVLSGSLSMVAVFFLRNRLFPKLKVDNIIDPRATNDHYVVSIDPECCSDFNSNELENILKETGAIEIQDKEVIE